MFNFTVRYGIKPPTVNLNTTMQYNPIFELDQVKSVQPKTIQPPLVCERLATMDKEQ